MQETGKEGRNPQANCKQTYFGLKHTGGRNQKDYTQEHASSTQS
jgi:hypothetical protein